MTPSEFISASVRGGWLSEHKPSILEGAVRVNINANLVATKEKDDYITYNLYRILLDPLAWSAVGKDRGWSEEYCGNCGGITMKNCEDKEGCFVDKNEAHDRQHRFLDLLQDGQTLLGALSESTL